MAPLAKRRRDRDLAIYVQAPEGSDGHLRRFAPLQPLMDSDGTRYDVFTHFTDAEVRAAFAHWRAAQYRLYSRILWKRIGQVWKARRHRAVFIQRALFPLYPDARRARLERLVRRLCDNVVLDFWDPVHLWQPEMTLDSLRYADTVAAVNEGLRDAFAPLHPDVRILPIAVDVDRFPRKTGYALAHTVRLFYTGSAGNVQQNLEPLLPVLEDLARERAVELIVVGVHAPHSATLRIARLDWDEAAYRRTLTEADLALYPFFGSPDRNRLRVASKTLDYLAAGVPFIGVREGLAAGLEPGRHFFAVDEAADWPRALRAALDDAALREAVASRGRELVASLYGVETVYAQFKRIVFERSPLRPAPAPSSPPAPSV